MRPWVGTPGVDVAHDTTGRRPTRPGRPRPAIRSFRRRWIGRPEEPGVAGRAGSAGPSSRRRRGVSLHRDAVLDLGVDPLADPLHLLDVLDRLVGAAVDDRLRADR